MDIVCPEITCSNCGSDEITKIIDDIDGERVVCDQCGLEIVNYREGK